HHDRWSPAPGPRLYRQRDILLHLRRRRRQRGHRAAGGLPPAAAGADDPDRGQAARPLRRGGPGAGTAQDPLVPRKAAGRRHLRQRGILRGGAQGHRLHRGRRDGLGTGAARAPGPRGPARRLYPRRLLAADGHPAGPAVPRGSLDVRIRSLEGLVAMARVFLTGADGYIGTVLAPVLMSRGHEVTGCDTGYHRIGWLYNGVSATPRVINRDIRAISAEDLAGHDAVIHLAELSNDPVGELAPNITYDINHKGSVRLAELAKEAGVERFIYFS